MKFEDGNKLLLLLKVKSFGAAHEVVERMILNQRKMARLLTNY